MNKAELAMKLAERIDLPKKRAEEIIETLADIVIQELKNGGEVTVAGFGAFSARTRASRMGVNPQNPSERITIPEVKVPKFKAGKTLKDSLKGKA